MVMKQRIIQKDLGYGMLFLVFIFPIFLFAYFVQLRLFLICLLYTSFNRTYFSFCSRRLQGDVWSTTLFAGDAVGVWGDRTDCWSSHKHQSAYQGIGNSASRSRAQGSFGGELVGYLVEEVSIRCLAHRKWLDAWW